MNTKMLIVVMLVCIILLLSSGCATVMYGKHQEVVVTSSPPEAIVVANKTQTITTPGMLTLKRGNPHILECSKEGYWTETRTLKPRTGGWVYGNILLGGIVGFIVDGTSGSGAVYDKSIHFTLRPKERLKGEKVDIGEFK